MKSTESTSSSSDDEENQRLNEATFGINCFRKEKEIEIDTRKSQISKEALASKKPSLRQKLKDEDVSNELGVTPEFQAHVARKLSSMIDSSIKVFSSGESEVTCQQAKEEDDFKLFSTSQRGKFEAVDVKRKQSKRQLPESNSDSDSEEERLRSVAVSGSDILQNSAFTNVGDQNSRLQISTKDNEETDPLKEQSTNKKKKKKKRKKNKTTDDSCNPTSCDQKQTDDNKT